VYNYTNRDSISK